MLHTPLFDLHRELGGKMVPFAGYEMPVQYQGFGVLQEHLNTRSSASLFDVSHMGQAVLTDPDANIERLIPGDARNLPPGKMLYTVLLNEEGGILDDLMITRLDAGRFYIVVNAACKDQDFALLDTAGALNILKDQALIALQGPKAKDVCPEGADLTFMTCRETQNGFVSRSGYTGEDGFEISLPAAEAEALARRLLHHESVTPAGLGARDSLRLEAGLCLYGHDLDAGTTPVEANLKWVIAKRRRESADFPGAARILEQLERGPARLRVGLRPEGRAPVREGVVLYDNKETEIGKTTSGTFGPTVQNPVAMGYVSTSYSEPGTRINALVRGRMIPCEVVRLPFVKPNYQR